MQKYLWVFFLLLALILIVLITGIRRLNIDENIYSIFPQGKEFSEFNAILKENSFNKQIIFSINKSEKESYVIQDQLDSISEIVIRKTSGLINEIQVGREYPEQDLLNYFYDNFPAYINHTDYELIAQKLSSDSIKHSVEEVNTKMNSVNALFYRKIMSKDPLGIAWDKLKTLNPSNQVKSDGIHVDDGILISADGNRALFTGVLDFELDDNSKIEQLNSKLKRLKSKINRLDPKIGFDYFGTFQIAQDNTRQVKEDTYVSLLISIGLILLLLILYYRSIVVPFYFILPALFASVCGLGIVGFIHPDISAISIATSAVLLGIVLDYSFHFFTHYRSSGDLKLTVKEIAFPMIVGSFTTIGAFSALLFTDSVVLQNFGLIALCTLSSAVIFTLILLPVLLKLVGFTPKAISQERKSKLKIPKLFLRISIFGILILTVLFTFKANGVKFDADLNNLSLHTEELIHKEESYTGLNPSKEKKLYLFVKGESKEEAISLNYALYESINAYERDSSLKEVVSLAPYTVPTLRKLDGYQKWGEFWKDYMDQTVVSISSAAEEFEFSPSAFSPFKNWISQKTPMISEEESQSLINQLGLSKLIYSTDGGWNMITTVVVDRGDLEHFKAFVKGSPGVFIFDVSEMANELLSSVQSDFNYLLLFSSLLVFLSLLVIYGRLELALFSFFPMAVSWLWILGIASIFEIEFNFVNIIVATFIFGLGDDFSIFMTDGLIQKYKTNSNSIDSYKSAILLSGLTTVIGTGALYFAEHPAIHSIAVISVVGILCIMLVTVVLQPVIFNFFVINRIKLKRSPITLFGLLYSLFLFGYFFLGCLIINVFLLFLIGVPVAKKRKRHLLNFIVCKLAKSTLFLGFHVKKIIRNPERLDFSKPSVIIANHSSFLDILLMIMLNPKVVIMVKKWVYNSPVFGFFIRYSGYLFIEEGTEYNLALVQSRIDDGYSIMIFPEGTRSKDGEIKRFHKGAFYLAQQLNIDVQPIIILGANYVNPKNDIIIKSGSLIIEVLERIKPSDAIYNQRFGLFTKDTALLMRKSYSELKNELVNADYLKTRVLYNYLYKSPVTEWYIRIKWRFEKDNFDFYDSLIGDRRKIYDVGCGLGYLSYYLHYRGPKREIVGIDFDSEKIAIAANGYDKGEQLQFSAEDVRNVSFNSVDVAFFNDVLHYLNTDDQLRVLNETVDNLNDNGVLFIRDGITDLGNRHELTKRTEKYSTRIVNFNKTSDELSFFSSADIFNFANERGLKCEMIEQSDKTSNVLFVLRKIADERD